MNSEASQAGKQIRDEMLELAVRVLDAIVARQKPDPADVKALRAYTAPDGARLNVDELACAVIRKTLPRHAPNSTEAKYE